MNAKELIDTATALALGSRGLLAMDESTPTCNARFSEKGIPQTEEMRRAYREWLIRTPNLGAAISGVILYDETIRERTSDGTPFVEAITGAGLVVGIKVDTGAKDLAGHPREKVTEGLDGLRDRLVEYSQMGARFAKWRAVFTVGDEIPSRGAIEANALSLARYAALCQEANLVPIVEPEVLMAGNHSLQRCGEVTEAVLRAVFHHLYEERVMLEGLILKPNMVLPGSTCPEPASVDEVAEATVSCLLRAVPAAVPAVAFLSGGQPSALASARLNAMHVRFKSGLPWALTFSFARALQEPALGIWRGEKANVAAAQQALSHRAICNRAACLGKYTEALEAGEAGEATLAEKGLRVLPKKLVVFDLDGTIAESKAAVDPEMAGLLGSLLQIARVAIISGGNWPQFQKQVISHLPPDANLNALALLPTCGTKFYRYEGDWKLLYLEDFAGAERDKIVAALESVVESSSLAASRAWGEVIEDRGSQITFSALGQEAPLEEKKKWDPDFAKRKRMKALLEKLIPEFSVRLGGTTSIDVTKPGIDKAYGIRKLRDLLGISINEMLFIGDALFPGGNDYPAKEAGVVSIQVRDSRETKRLIQTILACSSGVSRAPC